MADNKPQNEISTKLCLNCGTPVASFLSICPFCKQPVSGQPLVPLADNESTLTERPRAAAKPEHVSTPKAETNNNQDSCYKCGQETNLRDQYCSNCKSPTTRTIKSKSRTTGTIKPKPRTQSHIETSRSTPTQKRCVNCGAPVKNFFRTCPYCQELVSGPTPKPLVEGEPGKTDNVINDAQPVPAAKAATKKTKPPSKLMACPDCDREISTSAAACPHCGAPGPETRAEKKLDSQANAFVGIVVLVVMVFMLFQCGSDDEPRNRQELTTEQIRKNLQQHAISNVRYEVKDRLRDPDSYKIISETAYTFQDGRINVRIDYRAKNGFGGYVRDHAAFTCESDGNDCAQRN